MGGLEMDGCVWVDDLDGWVTYVGQFQPQDLPKVTPVTKNRIQSFQTYRDNSRFSLRDSVTFQSLMTPPAYPGGCVQVGWESTPFQHGSN